MKTTNKHRRLLIFFGITLFTQAVTSLVGGSIFLGPFSFEEISEVAMNDIGNSFEVATISIVLQMITAVVIIMLGVAMYKLAGYINETIAMVALCLYIFEAVLLSVGQIFSFALVDLGKMYITNPSYNLISLAKILYTCKEFAGSIAMIPFGIGAFMFYYLLLKAEIFPKWLGLWGMVTVLFILFGVPLMLFGVPIPFMFLVPYVPFEFFTGIYILVKQKNRSQANSVEAIETK